MMQEFTALDGAILIDKPAGPTSHDVVDAIRRQFGIKKVGHCGTLDPNAPGLLIIVLGRGTKLSERLMSDDKVYEGTMKFGETTDSYDAAGELVASLPVPPLTVDQLNEAAAEFLGDQMQTPPMVSAVKKAGCRFTNWRAKGWNRARAAADSHLNFRF
jgi:tRNA pseudouridine55 synthase